MDAIKNIREKAGLSLKKIILPETEDQRVLEAATIIEKEGIGSPILLYATDMDSRKQEKYALEFIKLRQSNGLDIDKAMSLMARPLYYAAMMVREGVADGFVAGASHTTPDVARAAIYCLGVDKKFGVVSSCFIMAVPDCIYGEEGILFFADCGIIPEPTAQQLAQIAISTAELVKKVFKITPRIAMLSYSTKSSASGKVVSKVKEATELARKLSPGLVIDGELQVDAAIVPEVARIKDPDSILGGQANVLIFPNLEAGNISYKLVNRLAKARAIGPLLQGLNFPCSDLSRGCSVEDIVDCVAVTAIRAQ